MEKIDLKKELKHLYQPSAKDVVQVKVRKIGPFTAEGPTIERVHKFIAESGRRPVGKHHEIYLNDIRKTDPEKWKTVIRQPMQ